MDHEINAGYVITDRLIVGDVIFVLGECEKMPAKFVTWKCKKGEKDYFWGHYTGDRLSAMEDLCSRALDEIQSLKSLQQEQNTSEKPEQRTRKKRHEPER